MTTPAELLQALLETTLAGSAAILLVLLLRGSLRRVFGAGVGYAAWMLVPLAMLAVLLPAAPAQVAALPVLAMQAPVGEWVVQAATRAAPDFKAWMLVAWACGALVGLLLMALQQRRFMRGLGRLRDGGDGALVADAVAGLPAAVGLLRPRIVLPADTLQRYDAAQRGLMLAHERTHIARGDLFANAAVALLRCLYWFNPLVHLAVARFRHDQELACDQQVLRRHPDARRAYGEAMLKTQLAGGLLPFGCHWGQAHPLRERIEMLKQPMHTPRRRMLGAAIAIVLSLATAYAAWAAQPADAQAASVLPAAEGAEYTARIEFTRDDGQPVQFIASGAFGQRFTLVNGNGEGSPSVSAVVVPVAVKGGLALDIAMRIEQDGKLLAEPRLVVRDGQPASVQQGSEHDGRFEGIKLQVTASASDAAAALRRATATGQAASQAMVAERAQPPVYPVDVLKKGVTGTVVMLVDVAADGSVSGARVERSSGEQQLDAAALDAVGKWKFTPAMKDGKPVAGQVRVPVEFKQDAKDDARASAAPQAPRSSAAAGYDQWVQSLAASWQPPKPPVDNC